MELRNKLKTVELQLARQNLLLEMEEKRVALEALGNNTTTTTLGEAQEK